MSNAPVSLATTTPNALPPPQSRNMRPPTASKIVLQPNDLWPSLLRLYQSSAVARECWREEIAHSGRPMAREERRASVKVTKLPPADLLPTPTATITKTCMECGLSFGACPHNAQRQEYCSTKCRDRAGIKRRRRDAGLPAVGDTVACKGCGSSFVWQGGHARMFCNLPCAREYWKRYYKARNLAQKQAAARDKREGNIPASGEATP